MDEKTRRQRWSRRKFLTVSAASGVGASAGCLGGDDDDEERDLPTPDEGEEDNYEQVRTFDWLGITRDYDAEFFEAQQQIRDTWEDELGLDIDISPTEFITLIGEMVDGEGDLVTMEWVSSPQRIDPFRYLHGAYHSDGPYNSAPYESDRYDEQVNLVETVHDPDEREEHAFAAQEIVAEDHPDFFAYHPDTLNAYNDELFTGWQEQPGGWTYWNLANLENLESQGPDTVIWGTTTAVETIHPLDGVSEPPHHARKMIYSRLARINEDGEFVNSALEDFTVVDDQTIDVTLRDDLVFHDGVDVTAEDLVFTIEYLKEWEFPDIAAHYEPIESIEQTGEYTARFNLSRPVAHFTTLSFARFIIMPQHIWDGVVEEEDLDHPTEWTDFEPIGSGPFEVADFSPGSHLRLDVFEDHRRDFDFDTLVWDIYGEISSAMGDLEGGNISFVQDVGVAQFDQADDAENLVATSTGGIGFFHVVHQEKAEPPQSDIVFRRALTHAIDKEALINSVLFGHGDPATDPIAPANEVWNNPDVPTFQDGVDEAVDLLIDAGYRWDEDGNLLYPVDRFEGDGPPQYAPDLE